MKQTILNSVCGAFGVVITFMFGEWSQLLTLFLITISIDYISGIVASLKSGTGLNSLIGYWGLAKKGLMLLIITLAHHMDVVFATTWVMNGAISFYMANELISITENYGRIGLPLPDAVKRVIATLKQDATNKEDK
ncbi:phage holin family protein [Paenibacillus sp. ACRRX]|uniref:phage holin family protein n=1 Tax=unclassified Paenibacillus TaxID=185978 RepID=UPI001EF5ABD0|nr:MULTISPECIES: phage holin family protein [unclassified Paenibacillus]MCG7405954.1 phage holin family protein [Paenibacillus sp. ACRRX]MDK8182408.1 phage holin family protein [Paenibacillus sp. UMB4589-SE434]